MTRRSVRFPRSAVTAFPFSSRAFSRPPIPSIFSFLSRSLSGSSSWSERKEQASGGEEGHFARASAMHRVLEARTLWDTSRRSGAGVHRSSPVHFSAARPILLGGGDGRFVVWAYGDLSGALGPTEMVRCRFDAGRLRGEESSFPTGCVWRSCVEQVPDFQ